MSIAGELRKRIERATVDSEFARLAPHLSLTLRMTAGDGVCDMILAGGRLDPCILKAAADIEIIATDAAWAKVLAVPPPPTFHSFTALDIANPDFTVTGDRLLIAQARPALERIVELIARSPPAMATAVRRDITQIRGSYAPILAAGERYEVFVETAGEEIPILFLHTAGADSRQFAEQLSDVDLATRYRMVAADLPFHGRSMPPRSWDGEPYTLTARLYADWCAAIIEQVIGQPAIVVGGSMGAAMALYLAAERPELLLGAVAAEPPFRAKGRINPYQNHVAVHGALHNGSFVRGLMSPESPEASRRRASWIYAQGAPGIYPGDLAFYSLEFDGGVVAPRIDATRTPIALLCGAYDYSASPEDGRKLAALIPGAMIAIMPSLGHFPMCEHADLFRPYLMSALRHVVDNAPPMARGFSSQITSVES